MTFRPCTDLKITMQHSHARAPDTERRVRGEEWTRRPGLERMCIKRMSSIRIFNRTARRTRGVALNKYGRRSRRERLGVSASGTTPPVLAPALVGSENDPYTYPRPSSVPSGRLPAPCLTASPRPTVRVGRRARPTTDARNGCLSPEIGRRRLRTT